MVMTPRISRAQLAKNGSKGFTNGMESLDTGPWREEAFRREDGVLQCPARTARGYGYGNEILAGGTQSHKIEHKERL